MADRITINDVRRTGVCAQGLREFCDTHGIDLRKLIREGIPFEAVGDINDGFLEAVKQKAREREHGC